MRAVTQTQTQTPQTQMQMQTQVQIQIRFVARNRSGMTSSWLRLKGEARRTPTRRRVSSTRWRRREEWEEREEREEGEEGRLLPRR